MGQLRTAIGSHVKKAVKFTGDELKKIIPTLKGALKPSLPANTIVPTNLNTPQFKSKKTIGDLLWHYPGRTRKIATVGTGGLVLGGGTLATAHKMFGMTDDEKLIYADQLRKEQLNNLVKSGKITINQEPVIPTKVSNDKSMSDVLNDPRMLGIAAAGGLGYLAYQKLKSKKKKED